jgi:hypothetical protein
MGNSRARAAALLYLWKAARGAFTLSGQRQAASSLGRLFILIPLCSALNLSQQAMVRIISSPTQQLCLGNENCSPCPLSMMTAIVDNCGSLSVFTWRSRRGTQRAIVFFCMEASGSVSREYPLICVGDSARLSA